MNNQQRVIRAFRDHCPKYAHELENLIRDSRSHDVPVLANCVQMICSERSLNRDIANPFPPGSTAHADWAAQFSPAEVVAVKVEPEAAPDPAAEPEPETAESAAESAAEAPPATESENSADPSTETTEPTEEISDDAEGEEPPPAA